MLINLDVNSSDIKEQFREYVPRLIWPMNDENAPM